MKVLVLCEYPPAPGDLATQGDLFCKGLRRLGIADRVIYAAACAEQNRPLYFEELLVKNQAG